MGVLRLHRFDSGSTAPAQAISPVRAVGACLVLTVLPLAAAASIRGLPFILGFRYSGLIWGAQLVLGLGVAALAIRQVDFPLLRWLPWVVYIFLSLSWVDVPTRLHVQDAFQITVPLLLGAVASAFLTSSTDLRRLRTSALFSIAVLVVVTLWLGLDRGTHSINSRTMPMTAVFLACAAVAYWPLQRIRSMLTWIASLCLAFASEARAATFVIVFLWLLRPGLSGGRRLTAATLCAVGALTIFYTPVFQGRFFPRQAGGTVEDVVSGNISGTGRFQAWPPLWDEAQRNIVQGVGVGEITFVMPRFWKGIQLAHNDYLRILLELGIVGLVCFLAPIALHLVEARAYARSTEGELRAAWTAAYLGLLSFLVVAITDNPLTYGVWFGSSIFVFLGAAYGATAAERAS